MRLFEPSVWRAKRVAPPWDLLRGKDVFQDNKLLVSEVGDSDLQHWAPNCCTCSRAREQPTPGVWSPPVPLRSNEWPKGIAEMVEGLPPSKRRKLDLDTDMADVAALHSSDARDAGRYFTLEHLQNFIARSLESWQGLESR